MMMTKDRQELPPAGLNFLAPQGIVLLLLLLLLRGLSPQNRAHPLLHLITVCLLHQQQGGIVSTAGAAGVGVAAPPVNLIAVL